MFKAAANVGRKEGTRFRSMQRSRTIASRFLFPLRFSLYLSHRLFSLPFAFLFFLAVSLSLYLSFHLSLSFCFSLFATRRCVWSVVAAARVDSLITLSSSSGPPPSVSHRPSRPLPTAMPPRQKGKKVPKIQGPVRKSSSMNTFTSPPALNRHPPYPFPCERRSSSAIIFSNLLYERNYLSLARTKYICSRSRNRCPAFRRLSTISSSIRIDCIILILSTDIKTRYNFSTSTNMDATNI